jgi:hypothetical protein
MRTRMTILTGVVLLLAACSGGDAATTTSSTSTTVPITTTEPTNTTTTAPTTTTTFASTTIAGQEIDVSVEGGAVVGPGRITVAVGEQVSVWVLSDVDAEIHVHGYDLFFEATAGVPIEVALTADVPGIFEVELEQTHTPLFALEVTP